VGNDADQGATLPSWQPVRLVPDSNTAEIVNLTVGTTVGPDTMYYDDGFGVSGSTSSHFGGATGFTAGVEGYIGFSLIIDDPQNPGNDLTVYGWARVRLEDDDGVGELIDWAYEDTGSSIAVGVPEPSTWMIVGALGVFCLVRRRVRC